MNVIRIVLAYALLIIAAVSKLPRWAKISLPGGLAVLSLALLLCVNAQSMRVGAGVITVLDVGQGQCISVISGDKTVLIDCGANAECTPEYLVQFAYLGNFYAQRVLGVATPRVGLMNIGAEHSMGTDLQKQTLALLRAADARGDLYFIGNIEAKDAIKGGCDVIGSDGVSGIVRL